MDEALSLEKDDRDAKGEGNIPLASFQKISQEYLTKIRNEMDQLRKAQSDEIDQLKEKLEKAQRNKISEVEKVTSALAEQVSSVTATLRSQASVLAKRQEVIDQGPFLDLRLDLDIDERTFA